MNSEPTSNAKKTILIIEDDQSIAELERDYLEINGFSVDIASTGPSGLKIAKSRDYDLIILDLMLPGIDGFKICRQLREETDIPILMISARIEEDDKIRGLGLGADDYITKPFSPGELVARVKSHLARFSRLTQGENRERRGIIELKGLRIDPAARQVSVNNREVTLTAKEFAILEMLCRDPNRVFSKEHIFEAIWGEEVYGDITTVTVHIRKIREKIEYDPSHPQYIETVWGVGYRFKL
jgi:DNA-binding response OmpR family regulator